MSLLTQLFASGGTGNMGYQQLIFTTSGSFTAPIAGKYLITAIGAGGGTTTGTCPGGAAGGLAQSIVDLAASTTITYTVGAGAGGQNGGTTTVAIPGYSTLVASGGQRGSTVGVSPSPGTGVGGNVMNTTGGTTNGSASTGGGAVQLIEGYPLPNNNSTSGAHATQFYISGLYTVLSMGRILSPIGNLSPGSPGPGTGGPGSSAGLSQIGGLFSGGGGNNNSSTYSGAEGGPLGGGAGGTASSSSSARSGGVGGVIIEYFIF